MPLIHVAQRLKSPDIDRIVKPFREPSASKRRTILMVVALIWTYAWSRGAPDHFLAGEAKSILPSMVALVLLSGAWAFWANTSKKADRPWVDVAGTIIDFVGLGFMFSQAWNLMIPFVALLPLACVNTGARFKPVWFYVAVAASIAIVGLTAPAGYWFTRPAVAVLAVVLLAGIPMTFNRVLHGLSRISEHAILARDSQSRFLAMMSHELRTPLHTVINAASLVGAYEDERQRATLLSSITTNANVLLSRVNDMLDVAASQAGAIPQDQGEPFDLRSVMQTVQAVINEQAVDRGTMLTFMYDHDQPTVLRGNPRRIEQVVTNLASNAIKYTPSGGSVVITASAQPSIQGAAEAELVVSVADTGIGIPDSEKAKIFEPFHQVSSGETRTHGGVGLGLHIIKQYSVQMNARITVEDNPGGGTIFTWRQVLPIADSTSIPTGDMATSAVLSSHAKTVPSMRCLVVDDNRSNREIIGRILTLAGHFPQFASDGEQGISKMLEGRYDVTFLDLHMPGLSGLDVLKAVQDKLPAEAMPKIVILTASTEAEASRRAMKLGAAGFLQKPLSIPALLETLTQLAAGDGVRTAVASIHNSPIETMRRISDEASMRAYLHNCLNELKESMDSVIHADEKISQEDRGRRMHRLKNALLNCGCSLKNIEASHLTERNYTHADVQQMVPNLHSLVASAFAEVSSAPEMAS